MWNNRACRYDEYYKTFQGAIEHFIQYIKLREN